MLIIFICVVFQASHYPSYLFAADIILPEAGKPVYTSVKLKPITIKGLKVDPLKPFRFEFLLDKGDQKAVDQGLLTKESEQIVKYFLACLTLPEEDLWVNLSPYEQNRIIPQSLGQTDLGRSLLAQDYILKQLSASLIDPRSNLGKDFWDRVYMASKAKYGNTQIPLNTYNKVWILADTARVLEQSNGAYVLDSHLKVMMEADYLVQEKSRDGALFFDKSKQRKQGSVPTFSDEVYRTIILPEIEKEVNEGVRFAQLRQIFQAFVLATWYKQNLKSSVINTVYANKSKVFPIQSTSSQNPDTIYAQYLKAYKKGAINLIVNEDAIPRKYFSGGTQLRSTHINAVEPAKLTNADKAAIAQADYAVTVDLAMISKEGLVDKFKRINRLLSNVPVGIDIDGQKITKVSVVLSNESIPTPEVIEEDDPFEIYPTGLLVLKGSLRDEYQLRNIISLINSSFFAAHGHQQSVSYRKGWQNLKESIESIIQKNKDIFQTDKAMATESLKVPTLLKSFMAEGGWVELRGKINDQMKDKIAASIPALKERLTDEVLGVGAVTDQEKELIASNMLNNLVRLMLRATPENLQALWGDQINQFNEFKQAFDKGDLSRANQDDVADKTIVLYQTLLTSLPEDMKLRGKDKLKKMMLTGSIFQWMVLYREVYGYLKGHLNIQDEELSLLGKDLIQTVFIISDGIGLVRNAIKVMEVFTKFHIQVSLLSKEVKQQYLIALYAPVMHGKAQDVEVALNMYEGKGISFKAILEDSRIPADKKADVLMQYLIAVYVPVMHGKAQDIEGALNTYEGKGLSFKGMLEDSRIPADKKADILIQYLIAVYNPVMEGKTQDLELALNAHEGKGISFKAILEDSRIPADKKADVLMQYLIAVYEPVMHGKAKDAEEALNAYEGKGISFKAILEDSRIPADKKAEVLIQYLIAVYAPVMEGHVRDVEAVLNVFEGKGISFKGMLEDSRIPADKKADVLIKYLIAVYAPVMRGKVQDVEVALNPYESKGISFKGILEDSRIPADKKADVLIQYLIAVYVPVMHGKAQDVQGGLKAYADKGISFKSILEDNRIPVDQKADVLIQYLIAAYNPVTTGKVRDVEVVLNAYEVKGISFKAILEDGRIPADKKANVLMQYLIAVYQPAMKGKAGQIIALVDQLEGDYQEQIKLLTYEQKNNLVKVMWRMALIKDGLRQWQDFLKSYFAKDVDREELVRKRLRGLNKTVGPSLNPKLRREFPKTDKAMAVSPGNISDIIAPTGGIKLNSKDLTLSIQSTAKNTLSAVVDQSALAQLQSSDFNGFYPVIVDITPIAGAAEILSVK